MCFSFMFQQILSARPRLLGVDVQDLGDIFHCHLDGILGRPWQTVATGEKHGDIQEKIMENQWETWKDP